MSKKLRAKYIHGDEQTRFFAKVDKTSDCWVWTAGLKDGYGVFRTKDMITVRAHKWLWEKINGKTPDGLELDHLCINRKCVNPNHLEAVTHKVNAERAPVGKRNWRTLQISHCPQGHEYTTENTYLYVRGRSTSRLCKDCRNIRSDIWRKQKSYVSVI